MGGDCSIMEGSPGLLKEMGDTDVGTPVSGFTMGDKKPWL